MYEISTRVPLMLRAPGLVAAGQVSERCVDHYDTFRAICDWAGVALDENRNDAGASYAHLLDGSGRSAWDDTRYGEYGDLRMVRTPGHKFVKRYPDGPHDLFELEPTRENVSTAPAGMNLRQCRMGWRSNWRRGTAAMRSRSIPARA